MTSQTLSLVVDVHRAPPQELLGTSEDEEVDRSAASSSRVQSLLTKTGRRLKLDGLADKLEARQAERPSRKEELLLGKRLAKVRGAAAGAADRLREGAKGLVAQIQGEHGKEDKRDDERNK